MTDKNNQSIVHIDLFYVHRHRHVLRKPRKFSLPFEVIKFLDVMKCNSVL